MFFSFELCTIFLFFFFFLLYLLWTAAAPLQTSKDMFFCLPWHKLSVQWDHNMYLCVRACAGVCVCVMVSGVKQILLKTPHPAAETQPLLCESHEAAVKLSLITTNLKFVCMIYWIMIKVLKYSWHNKQIIIICCQLHLIQTNSNQSADSSIAQSALLIVNCCTSSHTRRVENLLWLHNMLTSSRQLFAIMSSVRHSKPVQQRPRHTASVKWVWVKLSGLCQRHSLTEEFWSLALDNLTS